MSKAVISIRLETCQMKIFQINKSSMYILTKNLNAKKCSKLKSKGKTRRKLNTFIYFINVL